VYVRFGWKADIGSRSLERLFLAVSGHSSLLVYLDRAIEERIKEELFSKTEDLDDALVLGATLSVRPKAMTVAVILIGLFPMLISTGTGSEAMQHDNKLAGSEIG